MGADRSHGPLGGGAPLPDPERVAQIRFTLIDDAETCAAFAESPRARLAELNDKALAETQSGDLGECATLLGHTRDRIAALDAGRLEPRGGLAGLFDSRGKRLKAFRAAYLSAASAAGDAAADIIERGQALDRKHTALDTLWTETRDAVADLDAHIAAARDWLSAHDPAAPRLDLVPIPAPEPEPEADATVADVAVDSGTAVTQPEVGDGGDEMPSLDAPTEPEAADEPASLVALPHPLQTRLAALMALRAEAIDRLPRLRAAQNADCRAPVALKDACDAIGAWSADWKEALGLAGKRPRKVRPDPASLGQAQATLADRIAAAEREIAIAQARRAELETRAAPTQAALLAA